MINYGIVGIGGFGGTWVQALRTLEERGVARLAGAVVRNPSKYAQGVAELQARGCVIYPTLDAMLAAERGRFDVIGAPTGIGEHEPMAVQAMEAGYNVLIEKPVAGTVQEVESIRQAEHRTGRWCAVGYQFVYSPTIQWLRSRIGSGDLGALREGRSMIGWPRNSAYYARNAWAGRLRQGARWVLDGPATNATAHYLTNLLFLAEAQRPGAGRITAVRAELYRIKPIPSYDTSAIEMSTASGARLYHYVSHSMSESFDPTMTLILDRATISWQAPTDTAVIRHADGREEHFANPAPGDIHLLPFEQVARVAAGLAPRPLCGLDEAGPHVTAINLAFESSRGIIPVPESEGYRRSQADGAELIGINGMEEALRTLQARGGLFSDLGLPWAAAREPVAAEGYTQFTGEGLNLG